MSGSFPRVSRFAVLLFSLRLLTSAAPAAAGDDAIVVHGVQPFVDTHLLESISDGVTLKAVQPEPREVVLVTNEPWEGNTCAYYTIIQDGDLYRMYYRGSHTVDMKSTHEEVTCYAESTDGRRWNKPRLRLYEWEGSRENNIVWMGIGTHAFTPFLDTNPECPPEARYKAVSRGRPKAAKGLYIYQSPDGIHWTMIQDSPVITEGAFDSQNLAYWDSSGNCYVCYSRTFTDGVRAIQRSVSTDFTHWTPPELLTYGEAPAQHLYTNAIRPYPDVPEIRIGFPTRFLPKTQQVEPIFMSSRDGITFHRFDTAVIPQTAPADRDGNRSNYMANGLVTLPDFPDEWSVYATEAYYSGPDSRLRRFVYRKDGLAALSGTGEVLTKPLAVQGRKLTVNSRCAPDGTLRVEIRDVAGKALPGFEREDCVAITGDSVSHHVVWTGSAGGAEEFREPVRLRFILSNSELFAFTFSN